MPIITVNGTLNFNPYPYQTTCEQGYLLPIQPLIDPAKSQIIWDKPPPGLPVTINGFLPSPYNLFTLTYTVGITVYGIADMQMNMPCIDVVMRDQIQNTYPSFYDQLSGGTQTKTISQTVSPYIYYRNPSKAYLYPTCASYSPCPMQDCGPTPCECCGPSDCYTPDVSAAYYCSQNSAYSHSWLNSTFYPVDIVAVGYSLCDFGQGPTGKNCNNGACRCYNFTNFNIQVTVDVTATANCTGSALESPYCRKFCNYNKDSLADCRDDMNTYCFYPADNPRIMPISNPSGACQTFYPNYLRNVGVDQTVDNNLNSYCQPQYNLETLYGLGSPIHGNDPNVCACHLAEEQYQNYAESLFNVFPGYEGLGFSLGFKAPCLFLPCSSSDYPSITTGQDCNLPPCLIVNSFTNDGSFTNSNVTITDTTGQCSELTGTLGGSNGSDGGDDNSSIIIIIIIVIVILIILLMLITIGYFVFRKKIERQ